MLGLPCVTWAGGVQKERRRTRVAQQRGPPRRPTEGPITTGNAPTVAIRVGPKGYDCLAAHGVESSVAECPRACSARLAPRSPRRERPAPGTRSATLAPGPVLLPVTPRTPRDVGCYFPTSWDTKKMDPKKPTMHPRNTSAAPDKKLENGKPATRTLFGRSGS